MQKTKLLTIFALTAAFLFLSCKGKETGKGDPIDPASYRNVIVYMAADHNLSGYSDEDIAEMTGLLRENSGRLFVFQDRSNLNSRLFEILPTGEKKELDPPLYDSNLNSCDPEVMKNVLSTVIRLAPHDHYGLVLWSHATGWLSSPAGEPMGRAARLATPAGAGKIPFRIPPTKTFGFDKPTGSFFDVKTLENTLKAVFPNKLDFLLFDACYMASLECHYQLRGVADYIVSSPAEILGKGMPYGKILIPLFKQIPDLQTAAREFYEYYNNLPGNEYAAISVVKTSELESLAQMTRELLSAPGTDLSALATNSVQHFDVFNPWLMYDFGDFINRLLPGKNLDAFNRQLEKTVLYKKSTPSVICVISPYNYFTIPVNTFSGLTCQIPKWTTSQQSLKGYYALYDWYADAGIGQIEIAP